MADGFARRRFEWLDQVASNSSVSAAAFRLAYAISHFVNGKTGDAWPSQSTLADRTGFTERGIRKLAEQLARGGHLVVTSAHGRKHSNRYRPIFKDDEPTLFPPAIDQERGSSEPSRRRHRGNGGDPESAAAFEEFWAAYPRKVAKGQARRAYARVIASKKASSAELLNGAMRYAAECVDRDPKYVKHATTWLNGECWSDEPDRRSGSPTSGLASAVDGIGGEMFGDRE